MTTTTTDHAAHTTAQPHGRPRIVVGVDGSEQSLHALRWAIERARVSGEHVEPVYVFNSVLPADFSGFGAPIPVPTTSPEELAAAASARLTRSIDLASHDDVLIEPTIVDSQSSVTALVKAAADASMLVLGVHRRHWMDGMIGSTARACLKHAPCAVVVVPAPASHRDDDATEAADR